MWPVVSASPKTKYLSPPNALESPYPSTIKSLGIHVGVPGGEQPWHSGSAPHMSNQPDMSHNHSGPVTSDAFYSDLFPPATDSDAFTMFTVNWEEKHFPGVDGHLTSGTNLHPGVLELAEEDSKTSPDSQPGAVEFSDEDSRSLCDFLRSAGGKLDTAGSEWIPPYPDDDIISYAAHPLTT
jgi:hypothetical protein